MTFKKIGGEISLVVQWLRVRAPSAGGLRSIPGQGTGSHMPQIRVHAAATKRSLMPLLRLGAAK